MIASTLRTGTVSVPPIVVSYEKVPPTVTSARNTSPCTTFASWSAAPRRIVFVSYGSYVATQPPGASSAHIEGSAALAVGAVAAARALEDVFAADVAGIAWRAFPPDERSRLAEQVRSARESAQQGRTP